MGRKANPEEPGAGGKGRESPGDAVAEYLKDIGRYSRITRAEEVALSRRALSGDEEAQQSLVTSNLRLVVSIWKDFTRSNFAILDLVSVGNEGLIVASRKYDATRGVPFANYAAYWIKQRVMKYVAEHGFTVRIPPHRAAVVNKVVRMHTRLVAQMGRAPTPLEVASATMCSEAEVAEVMRMMQSTVDLDATVRDGEGGGTVGAYFGESVEAADERTDEMLRAIEVREAVRLALESVSERERNVLGWYFGIVGQPVTDLEEISRRLGVTRERARQIKASGLKKLASNERLRMCAMDGFIGIFGPE